jgi:hypothetical protein
MRISPTADDSAADPGHGGDVGTTRDSGGDGPETVIGRGRGRGRALGVLIAFGVAGGVLIFLMVVVARWYFVAVVEHDDTWGTCEPLGGWCHDVPVGTIGRIGHLRLPSDAEVLDSSAQPHGGSEMPSSLTAVVRVPGSEVPSGCRRHGEDYDDQCFAGSGDRWIITVQATWTGNLPALRRH